MIKNRNIADDAAIDISKIAGGARGENFYVCPVANTAVHDWLARRVPSGHLFPTVQEAISAAVTLRGDTIYVFPGDYTVVAEIAVTKDNLRIIGASSPNIAFTATSAATGVVRFKTVTANQAYVFNITGNYVQMHNIATYNNGVDTDNLGDLLVAGRNFLAVNCEFRGGNNTTQCTSATSGIPVTLSSQSYGARFDDCRIGSPGNATRTAGPGFVRFAAGTGGVGMTQFNNCIFTMRSETTGAAAYGIIIDQNGTDRLMIFRGCTFYNFSENWGALPDFMINDDQTTTHSILFTGGCGMIGFDCLSDNAHAMASDPLPHTNAVEALAVAIT
jgi:hypothetical protein